jgi:hypothetical protein
MKRTTDLTESRDGVIGRDIFGGGKDLVGDGDNVASHSEARNGT